MASLAGFEKLIESLVERSLISPLRGRVQPIEVAKRLERAMRDGALINVGTSLAPNQYVVRLNPEDFQPLAAARSTLERELARHLARAGAERGYAFLAPPIVRFTADPAVTRRAIVASAQMLEPGGAGAPSSGQVAQRARVAPPAEPVGAVAARPLAAGTASGWGLDFGGWTVDLPLGPTRVGRAPDCDVVVPSPRVSRVHAELQVDREGVRIRDAGSTNGTTVEGQPVREAALRGGERVGFGGVEARLVARGHEDEADPA